MIAEARTRGAFFNPPALAGAVVLLVLLVVLAQAQPAYAATITVNSTADVIANDGECTLREAITAANTDMVSGAMAGECAAGSGADTIVFSGNFFITLAATTAR